MSTETREQLREAMGILKASPEKVQRSAVDLLKGINIGYEIAREEHKGEK